MAASALLKNSVSIEEWMAETKEIKKHCISEKTVPCDLTVTYKEKILLEITTLDHSLLYFTKIFVHESVIAAVCYFSVYKLIVVGKPFLV